MKSILSKFGKGIAFVYLSVAGLYDIYFCYLWVIPPNASTEFLPIMFRLFNLAIYGWIWTSIKALVWPLFALGVFQIH